MCDDLDLDDLLNTGLEKVEQTKVESQVIKINSVVGQKGTVNYSQVTKTPQDRSVSPVDSPFRKTMSQQQIQNALNPPSALSASKGQPMGLTRQEKFIKAAPIADHLKEFFGPAEPIISSGNESIYLQMGKIRNSDKVRELFGAQDLNCGIKEDAWSSVKLPKEKWTDKNVEQEGLIVDVKCKNESGFHLEIDSESVTNTNDLHNYEILDLDLDIPIYVEYFRDQQKVKYYFDSVNKTLLIVDTSTKNMRALLKTTSENIRCIIPSGTNIEDFQLSYPANGIDKSVKPKQVSSKLVPKLKTELESIEEMALIQRYKFGVICVKKGQNEENQWFANDDCDPSFWEFMDLIGDRIPLQGFTGYRGGLDVKKGCTGKESYYKSYKNIWNIMYHVAPLLPNQPNDLQKLERKRHVGNDVVVIVFLEPDRDEPFDPRILTSHFNNIFVIVQPKKKDDVDGYVVNIATKSDDMPFPPFMKSSWMRKDVHFSEWMLRKLINSERMTMYNFTFSRNTANTRKQQLLHLHDMLQQN